MLRSAGGSVRRGIAIGGGGGGDGHWALRPTRDNAPITGTRRKYSKKAPIPHD